MVWMPGVGGSAACSSIGALLVRRKYIRELARMGENASIGYA